MPASKSDAFPRFPAVRAIRDLFERRVPHAVGIYLGASWGLIEFTDAIAVQRMLFSEHYVDLVLWAIPLLLPSEVVKSEFRKSVALFPFDLGPGTGEGDTWLAYMVPFTLEQDLLADDFFIAKGGLLDRNEPLFRDRLAERGFADLLGVPLTLKREVGEEAHAEFLTDGQIDRTGDLYRAVLRVYKVDDGSLEDETVHEGTDMLALMDELSVSVKRAVGIPSREGVEDIPVRQRLSDDDAAVEELLRGLEAAFVKTDFGAAIELTAAATARDPTFAAAQYVLSLLLQLANLREEALAPMQAAVAHEYRLPDRVRLGVKCGIGE